jgi:hypothetical protein
MAKKKSGVVKPGALIFLVALFVSCSSIDINNEESIIDDIQGTWTGFGQNGNLYTHIKLSILHDSFNGWVQTTESESMPVWAVLPNETGTYTLNSVQDDPEGSAKLRKFSFTVAGRCCGDKSLAVEALQKLVCYTDGKGLSLAGSKRMVRK